MNHPTPSSAEAVDTAAVRHYLQGLQQRIVAGLESVDGGSFATDAWERAEGGGGIDVGIGTFATLRTSPLHGSYQGVV